MQETPEQNITTKKEKTSFTQGLLEQLELIAIFFAIFCFILSSSIILVKPFISRLLYFTIKRVMMSSVFGG